MSANLGMVDSVGWWKRKGGFVVRSGVGTRRPTCGGEEDISLV